jgi:sugar lactone lactonase YvrE
MQRSRRDRLSWIRQARGTLVLAGAVLLALAAASAEGQAVSAGPEVTYAKPQVLLRNQLRRPAALAFHPRHGSLWIVNHGANSLVIVDRAASAKRRVLRIVDTGPHFLWTPSGIAFNRDGSEFATSQDAGVYGGFMGPTLWPGARSKFKAGTRLAAIHLDMLHHSPRSAGIAAGVDETRREYWVFNGTEGSVDRYFFNKPHPPGDNDHGDGLTYRYATGELERRPGVPAHLALDRATGNLYVADTAHSRVVRFATPDSTDGARMIATGGPKEGPLYLLPETSVETVVAEGAGLQAPSGLALHDGTLWVGDYATGRIHLFGLDGTPVRVIETGLGANSLTGITLGPGGWIYALDARRHRLVRLRASG